MYFLGIDISSYLKMINDGNGTILVVFFLGINMIILITKIIVNVIAKKQAQREKEEIELKRKEEIELNKQILAELKKQNK